MAINIGPSPEILTMFLLSPYSGRLLLNMSFASVKIKQGVQDLAQREYKNSGTDKSFRRYDN